MTRLPILLPLLMLAACAAPARLAPHVTGIHESQQAVGAAQESSRAASREIAELKRLSQRGDGKAEVILQWLNRKDQRDYEAP